jgi:hypothetical protein
LDAVDGGVEVDDRGEDAALEPLAGELGEQTSSQVFRRRAKEPSAFCLLHDYRQKGVHVLIQAFKILAESGPTLRLDLVGGAYPGPISISLPTRMTR